jgi:hypothetical protein
VNAEDKRIRVATNQAKRNRKSRRGPKTRAQRRAVKSPRWMPDSKAVDWPENVARWRKTA